MVANMEDTDIQLFDRETIKSLVWPDTEAGLKAKRFLEPLVKNNISYYIDNINADIFVLKVDQFVFPVIVAQKNYRDSFICSPYGQYISYAKEYLPLIGNRFLELCANSFLTILGIFLRWGSFNSVVYVNNWLSSTDLYPKEISSTQITAIQKFLIQKFPRYAIVFRSLNTLTNAPLIEKLKKEKFQLLSSRQIFVTDTKNPAVYQTRPYKCDLKLYKTSHLEVVDTQEIALEECPDLLKLHQSLYLDHHSYLNPQFNNRFIEHVFEGRYLEFKAVKDGDRIKGMAGYSICDGVMASHLFGYDKSDPQQMEVYRILNTSLLLEAQKRGLIFHQCSGAAYYKSIRHAEGCMDFMAVYTHHLPIKQRLSWATLRNFINTVAPRYMKKY